jgi:hypothetical protein
MNALRFALVIALLAGATASASMLVPVDVQTDIFITIGKLDRNYDAGKPATLGILYQEGYPESVEAKDDVVAATTKRNLPIRCVAINAQSGKQLRKLLTETDATILYVAPLRGIDIAEISRITQQRGIRSVTGVPEYVELGLAVGVGLRNKRPLIIINLQAARAEGAAFSSQLLALARIVGPLR